MNGNLPRLPALSFLTGWYGDMTKNKYYVYVHRDSNGKVFYVGKGTGYRVREQGHRSKEWWKIASCGFSYQILKDSMTSEDALELEKRIIEIYKSGLVNKTFSNVVKNLDFTFLDTHLKYDPTSPSSLVWKVDCGGRNNSRFSVGDVAGSKRTTNETTGCWQLGLKGTDYLVHRIVWVLHHGSICSGQVIDHLNGNPWDNRIENLALKSYANNARNRKYSKQSTDMLGVSVANYKTGQSYYCATWIDIDGKSKNRKFSIKKLGNSVAFEQACAFRRDKIEQLRLLGMDYTERHLEQLNRF